MVSVEVLARKPPQLAADDVVLSRTTMDCQKPASQEQSRCWNHHAVWRSHYLRIVT
jgi:hypothetical protein